MEKKSKLIRFAYLFSDLNKEIYCFSPTKPDDLNATLISNGCKAIKKVQDLL